MGESLFVDTEESFHKMWFATREEEEVFEYLVEDGGTKSKRKQHP